MDKAYSHYLIPAMHGSSSCSKSLFILGIFCLLILAILVGRVVYHGNFNLHFLIIVNDVKPVFLCLLAIYHFRNVQIFCFFFLKKICLLIFYYQLHLPYFYFD